MKTLRTRIMELQKRLPPRHMAAIDLSALPDDQLRALASINIVMGDDGAEVLDLSGLNEDQKRALTCIGLADLAPR